MSDIPEKSLIGAPVKVQFRREIEKLREMTFKKKLEYIWEYYKLYIIGLVIFAVLLGTLINTLLNPAPDTALFVAWNAGFVQDEQLEVLSDFLNEQIVDESKNEEVIVSLFLTGDGGDPTFTMANTQRLVAMLAAGVLDILIIDAQMLEEKSYVGFIKPLDDVLAEAKRMNPSVYSRIEENITYAIYETGEDEYIEKMMGINITKSPLLKRLGFFEQELYFSIAASTGQFKNIVKALILLFE